MPNIDVIWQELSLEILDAVGLPHDEARISFALRRNTVRGQTECMQIIAQYMNHHLMSCGSLKAPLPEDEAFAHAMSLLSRSRSNIRDFDTAYRNCFYNDEGGMRRILDTIADTAKNEKVFAYMDYVINRHVDRLRVPDKIEVVRQLFSKIGRYLPPSVNVHSPADYNHEYYQLLHAYLNALRDIASRVRRI